MFFHTIVAGQAPARGHTLHAALKDVISLSQAHGGHTHVQGGGGGQLDKQDVVVDGEAVVTGVLEHLGEGESNDNPLSSHTVHYMVLASLPSPIGFDGLLQMAPLFLDFSNQQKQSIFKHTVF